MDVGGTSLSASTTRRHLKGAGLKAVIKKKKPLLTARHRKNRLELALGHRHWTVGDWKRAMFSAETKINRLGSDGRRWAWKLPGEGLSAGKELDSHAGLKGPWMESFTQPSWVMS